MNPIPIPVIAVASDALAKHFSHARIDVLFMTANVSVDTTGNKIVRCTTMLRACNSSTVLDAQAVLGSVIEELMEVDPGTSFGDPREPDRERIRGILAKHGLSYHTGGKILGGAVGGATRTLESALRSLDLAAVEEEFVRCIKNVEADPPAALAAACSGIESLLKHYIEDESLDMPDTQTLAKLWKVVRDHLGWSPASVEEDDLKRILTGLASVVDGVGALRTHASAAHGAGRSRYRVRPRHARLAVHAAHSLAVFLIESWRERADASRKPAS